MALIGSATRGDVAERGVEPLREAVSTSDQRGGGPCKSVSKLLVPIIDLLVEFKFTQVSFRFILEYCT